MGIRIFIFSGIIDLSIFILAFTMHGYWFIIPAVFGIVCLIGLLVLVKKM
jgi:hypothetical protein